MAKAKRSKARKGGKASNSQVAQGSTAGITVQHFTWGAIFTGSKTDILNAGLASPEQFKPRGRKEYKLPLNHAERYQEAVFGPNRGPIPPSWDADIEKEGGPEARGLYAVRVSYSHPKDMDIEKRTRAALKAWHVACDLLMRIPPRHLDVQLGIKAREIPVQDI